MHLKGILPYLPISRWGQVYNTLDTLNGAKPFSVQNELLSSCAFLPLQLCTPLYPFGVIIHTARLSPSQ